jgi:ribosome maturation factor RimP
MATVRETGKQALRDLVERTVGGMGYELVDLERAAHGLVRVLLDVPESSASSTGSGVRLDDCERVSRQLTHLFAVEAVDFERLEVSSPGLDRPLNGARDFRRFTGSPVNLHLRAPLSGRRRWRGTLLGLVGEAGAEQVRLAVDDSDPAEAKARRSVPGKKKASPKPPAQTIELPLADIDKARLVPRIDFGAPAKARKEGPR